MVEINVHLFGKPEFELDLEKANPEDIKALGEELKERLRRAGEIVEKLEQNGWERNAGMYDITFYKKIKLDEAKEELKKLGISEDEVSLDDFDEEEEEEGERDEEEQGDKKSEKADEEK